MKLPVIIACLSLAVAAGAQRNPGAAQTGSISGTLFWRSGPPAADVRVSAVEAQGGNRGTEVSLMSIGQTDAGGRFHLENVPPGRYRILAGTLNTPSYFPGTSTPDDAKIVEVRAGAAVTGIDFRMVTIRFAGRILLQDLSTPDAPPAGPDKYDRASPEIVQVSVRGSSRRELTAPVAKDGSFEFPAILPDVYRITPVPALRGPEMTVTVQDDDIVDYRIVLPYIVAVTGSVTSDGDAPRPHFLLTFSDVNWTPPSPPPAPPRNNSRAFGAPGYPPTGQVTAYVVGLIRAQVPTGVYRVTVSDLPAGFELQSVTAGAMDLRNNPVTIPAAGLPPIRVVLGTVRAPRWPTIRGRIEGRGSFNTGLNVFGPSPEYGLSFPGDRIGEGSWMIYRSSPPTAVLFLDGTFEVPRLQPGRYFIREQSDQLGIDTPAIQVTNEDVNDVVVKFADVIPDMDSGPGHGPRIRGRIVGHAKAAPDARVILTGTGPDTPAASIYTDGTFEFPHVPAGVYQAEVIPPIPGATPITLRVGATDLNSVEIPVPATADLRGRVVVENGGPIPRALQFVAAGVKIPAPLQPDGRFMITAPDGQKLTILPESLPPGFAVRSMTFDALDLLNEPLRLTADGTNTLQIALATPAPVAVRGRVVSTNAALGAGHVWLVDSAELRRTMETSVTRNGMFEFAEVLPGTYTLRLAIPGAPASAGMPITVTAGKDVTVELAP